MTIGTLSKTVAQPATKFLSGKIGPALVGSAALAGIIGMNTTAAKGEQVREGDTTQSQIWKNNEDIAKDDLSLNYEKNSFPVNVKTPLQADTLVLSSKQSNIDGLVLPKTTESKDTIENAKNENALDKTSEMEKVSTTDTPKEVAKIDGKTNEESSFLEKTMNVLVTILFLLLTLGLVGSMLDEYYDKKRSGCTW